MDVLLYVCYFICRAKLVHERHSLLYLTVQFLPYLNVDCFFCTFAKSRLNFTEKNTIDNDRAKFNV